MSDRLVIALPKGALYEETAARLRRAGIDVPTDVGRRLQVLAGDGETELLVLRSSDVPAYVVFSDAVLRAMARELPRTPAQLRAISGVGEKKLADFGTRFLAAIAESAVRA